MAQGLIVTSVFIVAFASGISLEQTFKAVTELVTVPITVTSRSGNDFVPDLAATDFRIFEDNVEQTITVFDRARRHVSLCIVLDSSNSMAGWKQRLAAAAVQHVVPGLAPDDEASLVVFSSQPEVATPWTPAREFPSVEWAKWKATGSTALQDALAVALQLISTAKNPQPVILIVSDGEETGSITSLRQLVATRRQSETAVYAIHTEEWPPASRDRPLDETVPPSTREPRINVLPQLVGDSGGVMFSAQVEPQAIAAVRSFLTELANQYLVGYVSSKPPDGKYRRLKIDGRDRSLRLRYRTGYLATPRDL